MGLDQTLSKEGGVVGSKEGVEMGNQLTSSPRPAWQSGVFAKSHSDSAWGHHLFAEQWCGRIVGVVSVRRMRRKDGVAFLIPN